MHACFAHAAQQASARPAAHLPEAQAHLRWALPGFSSRRWQLVCCAAVHLQQLSSAAWAESSVCHREEPEDIFADAGTDYVLQPRNAEQVKQEPGSYFDHPESYADLPALPTGAEAFSSLAVLLLCVTARSTTAPTRCRASQLLPPACASAQAAPALLLPTACSARCRTNS